MFLFVINFYWTQDPQHQFAVGDEIMTINRYVAFVTALNADGSYDIRYKVKGDEDFHVHPQLLMRKPKIAKKSRSRSPKWDIVVEDRPPMSSSEWFKTIDSGSVLPPGVKRNRK
jgi:hypothetical protein